MVGKRLYCASNLPLYAYNAKKKMWTTQYSKPFTTLPAGSYIGVLNKYIWSPKKPSLLWLIFKDKKGVEYGFRFVESANQIDFSKFKNEGIKNEEDYHNEYEAAYDKTPFDALRNQADKLLKSNIVKFGVPLLISGIVIFKISK